MTWSSYRVHFAQSVLWWVFGVKLCKRVCSASLPSLVTLLWGCPITAKYLTVMNQLVSWPLLTRYSAVSGFNNSCQLVIKTWSSVLLVSEIYGKNCETWGWVFSLPYWNRRTLYRLAELMVNRRINGIPYLKSKAVWECTRKDNPETEEAMEERKIEGKCQHYQWSVPGRPPSIFFTGSFPGEA